MGAAGVAGGAAGTGGGSHTVFVEDEAWAERRSLGVEVGWLGDSKRRTAAAAAATTHTKGRQFLLKVLRGGERGKGT